MIKQSKTPSLMQTLRNYLVHLHNKK